MNPSLYINVFLKSSECFLDLLLINIEEELTLEKNLKKNTKILNVINFYKY